MNEPPPRKRKSPLKILVLLSTAVLLGGGMGVGVFTFEYANGTSYFSNDSHACANCHVMQGHLDAWAKSSHGKFAQCNDCHAPHDLIGKYYCKSRNGFFHSLAFTTGDFPDHIIMHDYNRSVVERNCLNCHADFVHAASLLSSGDIEQRVSCLHCHPTVGHDTP